MACGLDWPWPRGSGAVAGGPGAGLRPGQDGGGDGGAGRPAHSAGHPLCPLSGQLQDGLGIPIGPDDFP